MKKVVILILFFLFSIPHVYSYWGSSQGTTLNCDVQINESIDIGPDFSVVGEEEIEVESISDYSELKNYTSFLNKACNGPEFNEEFVSKIKNRFEESQTRSTSHSMTIEPYDYESYQLLQRGSPTLRCTDEVVVRQDEEWMAHFTKAKEYCYDFLFSPEREGYQNYRISWTDLTIHVFNNPILYPVELGIFISIFCSMILSVYVLNKKKILSLKPNRYNIGFTMVLGIYTLFLPLFSEILSEVSGISTPWILAWPASIIYTVVGFPLFDIFAYLMFLSSLYVFSSALQGYLTDKI